MTALDDCIENPMVMTTQLAGSNLRRLKVGNYRVIAHIQKQQVTIGIIRVQHRKNVYKL